MKCSYFHNFVAGSRTRPFFRALNRYGKFQSNPITVSRVIVFTMKTISSVFIEALLAVYGRENA